MLIKLFEEYFSGVEDKLWYELDGDDDSYPFTLSGGKFYMDIESRNFRVTDDMYKKHDDIVEHMRMVVNSISTLFDNKKIGELEFKSVGIFDTYGYLALIRYSNLPNVREKIVSFTSCEDDWWFVSIFEQDYKCDGTDYKCDGFDGFMECIEYLISTLRCHSVFSKSLLERKEIDDLFEEIEFDVIPKVGVVIGDRRYKIVYDSSKVEKVIVGLVEISSSLNMDDHIPNKFNFFHFYNDDDKFFGSFTSLDDDWWLLSMTDYDDNTKSYKCDGLEGLFKCFDNYVKNFVVGSKKVNESKEELYQEIDSFNFQMENKVYSKINYDGKSYNIKIIDNKNNLLLKISNHVGLEVFDTSVRESELSHLFMDIIGRYENYEFLLVFVEDNWWFVEDTNTCFNYKCDDVDGLLKCIGDIVSKGEGESIKESNDTMGDKILFEEFPYYYGSSEDKNIYAKGTTIDAVVDIRENKWKINHKMFNKNLESIIEKSIERKFIMVKNGYEIQLGVLGDRGYASFWIVIISTEDDWWFVRYNQYSYRCDGIDGLSQCLSYIKNNRSLLDT